MAHLVEQMFSVRETPWHAAMTGDATTIVAEHPTSWAEIRTLGGYTWDPAEEPVYAVDGINPDGSPAYTPVEGFKRIYRDDDGATLGVVKDSYQLIDHDAMGQIATAILGQDGIVGETGGTLDAGRKVWALFRVGETFTVSGDNSATVPYVALLNAHDGSSAFRAIPTAVRVVCANTWHLADTRATRSGAGFTLRHTKNWRDQLEIARHAVTGARREIEDYRELAEALTGLRVDDRAREDFVTRFVPAPAAEIVSDRVRANIETARANLRAIFDSPTTEPIRHTAYGLVQGAGEYLDHVRAYRSQDSYVGRTLLSEEKLKRRATTLAREVALV